MKRVIFYLMFSLMFFPESLAQSESNESLAIEYSTKARHYELGIDCPKDLEKAFYWKKKAAELGYAAAQCGVGLYYEKGKGTSIDYNQAIYWFRKSADQGYSDGQWGLARCYKDGKGVPKDINQAIFWYSKAAEQDGGWPADELGDIYYNGVGIKKDYAKAMYWYKKGSNYKMVKEKLEKFEWNGMYKVGSYGSYGLVSSSFNQILPPEYHSIESNNGYIYAKKNSSMALLTSNGQILIPASMGYTHISIFRNSDIIYYKVSKSGRYGLIDKDGKTIVPCEMEALESAGTGYLRYKLNDFWGLMNYQGKVLIDTKRGYTSIGDYKSFNKRFAYTMPGYKGECDATGRQISKIKVVTPSSSSIGTNSGNKVTIANHSANVQKYTDAQAFGLKGKVEKCMWLKGARGKYYLKPFGYALRFDETGKITWADAIIIRDKNGRIEKMKEKNGRNEILFEYDSDGLVSRFYFGPKTKDIGEGLLMNTIYDFEYDNKGNVITVKESVAKSKLLDDKPNEVVRIKYTEFDEKGNWKKREYECEEFDVLSMTMEKNKYNESRIISYYK